MLARWSAALLAVMIGGFSAPAFADDPSGVWLRDSGTVKVRVAKCGAAYCGKIVWLKNRNGPAKVGQRVIFDMVSAAANRWEGKAFNPEDGQTYQGTMRLAGNSMVTQGCVLGGLICRSLNWRKVE